MEIIGLAIVIDIIIGDNLGRVHPVVLIGKLINFIEDKIYQTPDAGYQTPEKSKRANKIAGTILLTIVVLTSVSTSIALMKIASLNNIIYIVISAILISMTFALRGLLVSGYKIFKALSNENIEKARQLLAQIVGRGTKDLSKGQIIKATIESLAENTVDGIIAPLFYALIGGPALALAYRSINTLDSMVGYKNERYIDFGWASAKMDDIANFIPARICLVFVWIATLICRLKFKETIKYSINDGPKHQSPNSGLTEAAFAGALGIELGGIAYYQGIPKQLPTFGKQSVELHIGHIKTSLLLVAISSLLFFVFIIFIKGETL